MIITDSDGVMLDASMMEITDRWRFLFTTDRDRAARALIALDAPGGYNIVEPADGEVETDVNLESLYELVRQGKMK